MMQNGASSLQLRVAGIVRGVDIDRHAHVTVGDGALIIAWDAAAPWELWYEGLDGITVSDQLLTLYLHGGDVLELRSAENTATLASALLERVYTMPELTRGLRSLGSLRGSPGAAHDRWFAPLLSARRAVVGVADPMRQLNAFDATRLRSEYDRAIEEIAAVCAPEGGAYRRAVEAGMEEEAEPLFAVIAALGAQAARVGEGPADTRLLEWRRWVVQLQQVFAIADECWPSCSAVLAG